MGGGVAYPNVSICEDVDDAHFNDMGRLVDTDKPINQFFSFTALENSTFKFSGSTAENTLSYSLDSGSTWVALAHNTDTPTVQAGNSILWKGTCTPYSTAGIGKFISSGRFNVQGNIMSLIYQNDYLNKLDLRGKDYVFRYLFSGNTNVVSAENMSLPANYLSYSCYNRMFESCTSLTTPPELPATNLSGSCYGAMFAGCTSLTSAPDLPATNLDQYCYAYMFQGCTSLTTVPKLLGNKLVKYCYQNMFDGCTGLVTVPSDYLPATTLGGGYCYARMFYNCTSLTTAPELPATTLVIGCYDSMFAACRNLTSAPTLPATTLTTRCYQYMFQGCTSLTTAPVLPTKTLTEGCYYRMFTNCSNLKFIQCLATDITATDCTYNWVSGVASAGTFVKDTNMSGWTTGINGIPTGWTVEDAYVEIGGIKWATMSVGATAITDTGLFFQWGDTQGYTASQVGSGEGKKYFDWDDYKYFGITEAMDSGMTKYNNTDGKTVLDLSDDGVNANWGGNWRMPTQANFTALRNATNSAWTTDYKSSGIKGIILTDKTDSSKELFFRANGCLIKGTRQSVNTYNYTYSNTLPSDNIKIAIYPLMGSNNIIWNNGAGRNYGFNLRGILDE